MRSEAKRIWGKTVKETIETIKSEVGEPKARVACIGPAGEKLVRFANIIFDNRYAAGRGGLGAVMGSKNLKAIAVRGSLKPKFYDMSKLTEITKWFNENWRNYPGSVSRHKYGTSEVVLPLNRDGTLPTLNFRGGSFDGAEKISGENMSSTILIGREGCFACPLTCKLIVKAKEPYETDPTYGGPEYETIASFGSLCGISDINVVAYANQICNAYGVDTISAGVAIAYAMEIFENGLISEKDTDGIKLRFGDSEAMMKMLMKIVNREGFGNILAEGVRIASQKIKGSEKFAMHVKGKEIPMHEPRGKVGVGLMYAISPHGADHMQFAHDSVYERESNVLKSLGIISPVNRLDMGPEKVRTAYYSMLWWGLQDCLGICKFTFIPHSAGVLTPNHLTEIVNAVTGWNTSLWELMKCSERALNLTRCFNIREGITTEEDTLPKRFFKEMEFGARKGSRINEEEFRRAVKLFYEIAGWDEEGKPRIAKLCELGIEWALQ
ncbi:MAG: aldehyde ferredoxin oxidoreductase C-terminal domain-containing protein [Candidatus Methanomethylicia archaeon]